MHDISQITENCHHTQRLTSVVTCHVFVVDYKTLCGFLNIAFLACIFIMCVASWNSVGLWLVQCWVMVSIKLGHGWCNVRSWLVQCWLKAGIKLGDGWCNVGSWLVQCWLKAGTKLGDGWCNVGL